MLNAIRRGPASVAARSICSSTTTPACLRSTQLCRLAPSLSRSIATFTVRPQTISPESRRALSRLQSIPNQRFSSAASALQEAQAVEAEPSESHVDEEVQHGPVTKFKELAERNMVCQSIITTLTQNMGLETMTQVQSLTINETLKGIDVLAQARTGTGKTLAFLIPVLQNIIKVDPSLERAGGRTSADDIRAIIISPTRELAEQIAEEARKVTRKTGVIVQTAVGGSSKQFHMRAMKNQGCHILVGTPGRLKDILSDPYSGIRAPKLSAFVLDEADRLLDDGFAPEIEEIQTLLPDRRQLDRQTLLFSATMPREIMQIVRKTMKPDFKFVRTVQEGEQQTHERVPQKVVKTAGFENLLPSLVELCKRGVKEGEAGSRPFKAMVYFPTTADTSLASSMLKNLRLPGESRFSKHPLQPAQIIEIHARLGQSERTQAATAFKRATSAILVSSDVTARGMDFPNVTHVIQVGVPPSEEQYVHRIGRTARGDKTGEGWLLVADIDSRKARQSLRSIPLTEDKSLETATVDMKKDAQLTEETATTLTQVGEAMRLVPSRLRALAYVSHLGLHGNLDRQQFADALNDLSRFGLAMETPPAVSPRLLAQLRMNVPGMNVSSRSDSESGDRPSYGSRGGQDGGYGGQGGRQGGGGYGSSTRPRTGGYGSQSRSGGGGGYGREGGGYGRESGGSGREGGGYGRESGGSGREGGGYGRGGRGGSGGYGSRGRGGSGGYGGREGGGGRGGEGRGRPDVGSLYDSF